MLKFLLKFLEVKYDSCELYCPAKALNIPTLKNSMKVEMVKHCLE